MKTSFFNYLGISARNNELKILHTVQCEVVGMIYLSQARIVMIKRNNCTNNSQIMCVKCHVPHPRSICFYFPSLFSVLIILVCYNEHRY